MVFVSRRPGCSGVWRGGGVCLFVVALRPNNICVGVCVGIWGCAGGKVGNYLLRNVKLVVLSV